MESLHKRAMRTIFNHDDYLTIAGIDNLRHEYLNSFFLHMVLKENHLCPTCCLLSVICTL